MRKRRVLRTTIGAALGAAVLAVAVVVTAQERQYVKMGALTCHPLPGPEFSTDSGRRMLCEFRLEGGDRTETYFGRLHGLRGVETSQGVGSGLDEIRWDVLAPKGSVRPRWLATQFFGGRSLDVPTVREGSLIGAKDPFAVLQPIPGGGSTQADELALIAAQ